MAEEKSTPVIPNRLNLLILIAQVAGIGVCLYALTWVGSWVWLLALVFGLLMNSVYSVIHEAEHGILFFNRRWNDIAGSLLALFFPAPFHLIRQGHLGHHLRNRTDDEAFDFYFEGDHKVWKFLVFYGILTGFYYLVVVLSNVVFLLLPFGKDKKYWQVDQASTAFMNALNPRYRNLIRLECAGVFVLHGSLLWGLGTHGVPVWHYMLMFASFGFMWSAMQYVHHYGTERHVTRGARNLWIWKPLDLLWMNHNWHLKHHENPSLPWVYLPDKPESPRGFLPIAYLRMWRGPRLATSTVKNPHADKVIP